MPGFGIAEAAGVGLDGRERPSEDVVVVLPEAVILLDGASTLREDLPSGGSYARELGAQLAGRLTAAPEIDLAQHVAAAIRSVARHNGFTPGESPSSTVSIVRWDDTTVEALVLCDSPVAVFLADAVEVVADDRLRSLPPGGYRGRLSRGEGFGAGHCEALQASGDRLDQFRNTEGGFWVAEAVPAAAHQAVRASWPLADVRAVLMASDGVSCGVDDYGIFSWEDMRSLAASAGPQAVLDAVREAEKSDPDGQRWPRVKPHDDQALVYLDFS
ncbi:hypothetical protein [Alloactinosynnema sp. L-07]|uniref:hypothetical protein n=1 Tax=Alloactinosynnema sp. L-07 TaxID=1653480 RepID=UPI00065EF738|nr:hypothetical protein [Alloactinosynnema sp. L-07]CRK60305.1 hypothetical protein [Alloactinosynnema sp. L-07]